jgi:cytochrome b561
MLVLGTFVTAATPNSDPAKLVHLRGHMIVGMVIFVLMLIRVVVRWRTVKPAAPSSNSALENRLAGIVHFGLYALVFILLGSGIAMSVMTQLPLVVFQGQGSLPESFNHLAPRAVHGIAATLLMLAIAAHIGAVLVHVFIKKDGLLKRMGLR